MADSRTFSLSQLAQMLGAELLGDGEQLLTGVAALDCAAAGDISFLASDAYKHYLAESRASAVVLRAADTEAFGGNKLIVADPYLAYAKLSAVFDPRPRRETGVHPSAVVATTAQIASSAAIGANCVIGEHVVIGENCEIYPGVVISENSALGDNCLLYANVSIYANVRIGANVIIHSGTVIGSDGFGFAPSKQGWVKIHQVGGVVIGNNVEIGAATAIDRGAIGDTIIHDGVIIDNQVHIAHNVEIDCGTAIAGCVGIAGSTYIGKNCTVAGAVAINGHIRIADNSHFHGGTIVTKGTSEAGVYASAPPMQEVKKWRRAAVRYSQLDELAARVKKLEQGRE